MKTRSILVWIVALVTLGSGLINLFSLIGPALPERTDLLRKVFSLEFLHLSRFLTLLIGFSLVISSINIYKRKKRAFQLVFLLSCLSVLFHMTKGLDYEEALFSLALLVLLFLSRKHFTVKSSIPDLRLEVLRFGIAVILAFIYGVAGFWVLERKDFGRQLSSVGLEFQKNLDSRIISEDLRQAIENDGLILSQNATISLEKEGHKWLITDHRVKYNVTAEKGKLHFYEFGINFTLGNSIHEMLLFFTLQGDSQLVPRTRYAHWFLDSLYLMTMTAIGYSVFALFRPVVYKFRTISHDRALATHIVTTYGGTALDYFKLWPDKSYFFSPSKNCFIAYRIGAHFAVTLGDPVGPEAEIEDTIRQFIEFCEENDWGLAFHQTSPNFLPIYGQLGFKRLKIGDEALVDLTQFTMQGKAMKEFRHIINQMEKSGVHILQYEPPIPDKILLQAKAVSDEWLQIPGRRERGFTVGRFEPNYIRSTPLFMAVDGDGKILAFVNIIPSYYKGETTIDLMRRRTEVPNGIMDYLFLKLFLNQKEEGFSRFNLGLAPMSGFQEKEEASPEERAVHYFFQHLNFLFSFTGLRQYKAKFAHFWEPRYVVYRNVLDLPKLAIAIREVSEFKD